MPQKWIQAKASKIIDRIKAIDAFIDAAMTYMFLSPVIIYDYWMEEYEEFSSYRLWRV